MKSRDNFPLSASKNLRKNKSNLTQLPELDEGEILPNSFCETSKTLILKSDKGKNKKEKTSQVSFTHKYIYGNCLNNSNKHNVVR